VGFRGRVFKDNLCAINGVKKVKQREDTEADDLNEKDDRHSISNWRGKS